MKRFLFLMLVISFAMSSAHAATHFVDDDGGYDFTSISACVGAVSAGETCAVRDGDYAGFRWSNGGSPGAWITVVAVDGHSPVVTSNIGLDDVDYIHIEGLTIESVRSYSYTGPKCNNLKIMNNSFVGAGGAGIAVSLRGDDILIDGNTFDQFGNDIVRQFGERWAIRNNTVINETESPPEHMDFWQTFCGGAAPNELVGSYGLIENNRWIDVIGSNVHFALGNATSGCGKPITHMIIRNNIVARSGTRFVVFDDNSQAAGTTKNVIYNNTFYQLYFGSAVPTWLDYITMNGSTHSSGINNIFYRGMDYLNVRGFLWATGGEQSCNLYYDPGYLMTFSSPALLETGAMKNIDPMFVRPSNNDFSLEGDSDAIDAGGPLTSVAVADTGSGTVLVVDKAEFFQDGWGGAEADWIAIGHVNKVAQIASINYSTNTITLAASLSRLDGDPVYLFKDSDGTQVFYGRSVDMGAIENGSDDGGGGDGPGSISNSGGGCFLMALTEEDKRGF